MSKVNESTCTCCGADITAPQFFNGKAYGWSCILKVNPSAKRSKKAVYVKYDLDSLVEEKRVGTSYSKLKVKLEGSTYAASNLSGLIQGGYIQLVDNKGFNIWKSHTRALSLDSKFLELKDKYGFVLHKEETKY